MSPINLPPWWNGAGIDAKASWLVSAGHAKNYAAACSMLAKRRRRAVTKKSAPDAWYLRENA